jgi:uncharacterized coiled-coil protein SlyX
MSSTIASLVANISANTSGLESGLSRAKGMMQETAGQMKSMAGNTFTAEGAMGGWTKSTYAAAAAGSMLVDKAYSLEKAVSGGSMTAAQATKQFNAYRNELQQGVWQTMTFGEKADIMRQKLSDIGKVAAKVTAAGVAVGYVAKQGYELARSGAEIGYTAIKFDRLSESVGTTSAAFFNELRVATKGTVSDFGLMKQGSDLLQLGLAKDSDEAIRLSRVMTALGMDTGEMTLALANQSKRRLDQLGLSLSAFNKIEAKLKESGMGKEEAFKEAFLQTAETTVMTVGNRADTTLGSFLRLEASASNLWNTFKQTLPDRSMGWLFGGDTVSQTAEKVGMFMSGMSNLMSGKTVWDLSAPGGGLDFNKPMWTRQANVQDMAARTGLWNAPARPAGLTDTEWRAMQMRGNVPGAVDSGTLSYVAQGLALQAAGRLGAGAQAPGGEGAAEITDPAQIAALVSGGLKLTDANQQYTETIDEMNVALREEQTEQDRLQRQYGRAYDKIENQQNRVETLRSALEGLSAAGLENELVYTNMSKQYQYQLAVLQQLEGAYGKGHDALEKQKEKTDKVKEKIDETKQAYIDAGDQMLLSVLSQREGTEQLQLDYARASGEISQQAFMQQTAILKVADALESGKINAQQATSAIGRVMSWDGAYGSMTMDVFINYIITGGGGGGTFSPGIVGPGGEQGVIRVNAAGQRETRRAVGGPVIAGGMYNVTEYGQPEILSAGGSQYLMMGNQGGYVTPLRGEGAGRSTGGDAEAMYAMLSRIPSADDNARALVRAMAKYWSPS